MMAIHVIALCGCDLGKCDLPAAEIHAHFKARKDCDRKARVEFQRLMRKWGQRPLPENYWASKEET